MSLKMVKINLGVTCSEKINAESKWKDTPPTVMSALRFMSMLSGSMIGLE